MSQQQLMHPSPAICDCGQPLIANYHGAFSTTLGQHQLGLTWWWVIQLPGSLIWPRMLHLLRLRPSQGHQTCFLKWTKLVTIPTPSPL